MARPQKIGLDYFPVDINFLKDIKVRKIIKSCGAVAPTILLSILSSIYSDHGYYIEWSSDVPFMVADELGVSEDDVTKIVEKAIETGFFNKDVFFRYSILTSSGIQKRFIAATNRRTRTRIIKNYWVIADDSGVCVDNNGVNDDNNVVYVDNNGVNDDRSTQSKVKKRKVKESKVKESKEEYIAVVVTREEEIAKILAYYCETIGSLPPPSAQAAVEGYLDHMDFEVIRDSIEIAAAENKRTWSYINGILKSRKGSGVRNMADVARQDEEFRKRKQTKKSSNPYLDMEDEE